MIFLCCSLGFLAGYIVAGFLVLGDMSMPRWPWPRLSPEMEALRNIRDHHLKRMRMGYSFDRDEQKAYMEIVKKISELEAIERARATDHGRRSAV